MSDSLKKILMDMKEHSSMFLLTNEGGRSEEYGGGIADGSNLPMLAQKSNTQLVQTTNPFLMSDESSAESGHQVYEQDVDEREPYFQQLSQEQ